MTSRSQRSPQERDARSRAVQTPGRPAPAPRLARAPAPLLRQALLPMSEGPETSGPVSQYYHQAVVCQLIGQDLALKLMPSSA